MTEVKLITLTTQEGARLPHGVTTLHAWYACVMDGGFCMRSSSHPYTHTHTPILDQFLSDISSQFLDWEHKMSKGQRKRKRKMVGRYDYEHSLR